MWTEAGAQPHVEEALSIGGFGYPVSRLACCVDNCCSVIVKNEGYSTHMKVVTSYMCDDY